MSTIEAWWKSKGDGNTIRKPPLKNQVKGICELQNLSSSINYDGRCSNIQGSGLRLRGPRLRGPTLS